MVSFYINIQEQLFLVIITVYYETYKISYILFVGHMHGFGTLANVAHVAIVF